MTQIFIDESGDLGWTFDKPHDHGGSSRYLTLAFLLVEDDSKEYPKRLVRKYRRRIGSGREFKAYHLNKAQIVDFAHAAARMMSSRSNIKLFSITVNKTNVQPHIREDPNKLYNYMVNLALIDEIKTKTKVLLNPDNRSIKVASGHSLVDYLQTQLWFVHTVTTLLEYCPLESTKNNSIQFVDVIAHIVWASYERHHDEPLRILSRYIKQHRLFFN